MTYTSPPPNGIAASTASAPVVAATFHIPGTLRTTPALNYEFLTDTPNGWFDALGYNALSFTLIATSTTSGVISFECTNDPASAPGGVPLTVQDTTVSTLTRLSSFTFTATVKRQFEVPFAARYVRIRVSTAVPVGTVAIAATFRQMASPPNSRALISTTGFAAGTNSIADVKAGAGTNFIGYTILDSNYDTDMLNLATGTTVTSAAIPLPDTTSASFGLHVSSITGTNATQDTVIQETYDNVNYVDLYHYERVTAIGTYNTPTLRIGGQSIRYIRTIGGTGPSVTSSMYRCNKPNSGIIYRNYFDRSLNPNVLSSTTTAYYIHGCNQIRLNVLSVSATSACVITLQGSFDKITWYSWPVTTTVSAGVAGASYGGPYKWVRAIVTTAGAAQVLSYVQFTGSASH